MALPPPAVEFRRVTKRFGRTTAVDAVSFEIAPGEFFSLLGPSGCGKTTTLRLLAGLESPEPDGGSIALLGADVTRLPPHQRPLAMVFQNYALFPHLSVERNVAFGLEQRRRPAAEIRERVGRALELVHLDPATFAARRPAQLSGGQRQRVALARALVLEPRLLLLDEPLGALDLKLRHAMQAELRALHRDLGVTFVYVTHDQDEALTLSDRIAVMDGGRIAQVGTPAEVYERPASPFVARFIGEVNLLEGEVSAVRGATCEVRGRGERGFSVAATGLVPGARVTVAVRPEWLTLHRVGEAPAGANVLAGLVREVVYRGDSRQVQVEVPGGAAILVAVPADGPGGSPWQVGEPALVSWRAEHGAVVEAG
jgi:spermidine/putrescine ABC transporter ATP-binding subunit